MSSQRPFDLKKLDFEAIRLAKRRKLLLYSLPVALIMIIICIKMLSVPILSSLSHVSYDKAQYKTSGQLLYPLYVANWIEPYKLPFNHGNALFKQGDYRAAEGRYREALKSVPEKHECSVRINLALSLEAQADVLMSNKSYDDAIVIYDDVKAVLYDGEDSCGVRFNDTSADEKTDKSKDDSNSEDSSQNGDEKDSSSSDSSKNSDAEQAKNVMNRTQEKSSTAKRQRNGDEANTDDSSNDDSSDTESTKEKLDQLEEKSQSAQRRRVEQNGYNQRRSTNYDNNDRSYKSKNW